MARPTSSPTFAGTHGVALDVGERRIGVASARLDVRFASPVGTLQHPATFLADAVDICRGQAAAWVVIGLPRGMDGQDTEQTARVRAFGAALEAELQRQNLPIGIHWTDEALTSVKAEQELNSRGRPYERAEVDALAATYILEDYLNEHPAVTTGENRE